MIFGIGVAYNSGVSISDATNVAHEQLRFEPSLHIAYVHFTLIAFSLVYIQMLQCIYRFQFTVELKTTLLCVVYVCMNFDACCVIKDEGMINDDNCSYIGIY